MRQLIIDGKQKPGKRVVEYFITFSGWAYILVFIVQVSLSILLWRAGFHYLRKFIISSDYLAQTINLTSFTIITSFVVLFITLFWSFYNKFRYGKLRRRKKPLDVSIAELAEQFTVSEEFISTLQNHRWLDLEGEVND